MEDRASSVQAHTLNTWLKKFKYDKLIKKI